MDTRATLGPNMRAAGFVHLSQAVSPLMHPHYMAGLISPDKPPSTPGSRGVPTPSDPPPFPPIMFVNPSAVSQVSMWEYQRNFDWTLAGKDRSPMTQSNASTSQSVPELQTLDWIE